MPYETICLSCGIKQEILEAIYSRGCPNCEGVLFQDIDETGQVIRIWQFNFSEKRLDYVNPNPIAIWSFKS
ncbi:MAG: hypothetical protein ACE5I5_15580 [Candidatus Heimdallarchaeota archaeon]